MADNIFGELVDWWLEEHPNSPKIEFDDALHRALIELSILSPDENIVSRSIEQDWYQNSEQTYMTVGSLDFESRERLRTVKIAAYAIITPPPLPLSEVAEIWRDRTDRLAKHGVNVPPWYLVWKATIFAYYPPYSLLEYISKFELDSTDLDTLADSLNETLRNLARLSLHPLGLMSSLRTNSFQVFYCGMGFDVGESTSDSPSELLKQYEAEVLPKLPEEFRNRYLASR